MSKTDLAYAAGIIDGEGCIYIQPSKCPASIDGKKFQLRVYVTNTNPWLCNWLRFSFGGSVHKRKRPEPRRTCWNWVIGGKQAMLFLKLLLPYLRLKQSQAELAIDFQRKKRLGGGKPRPKGERVLQVAQAILLRAMHHEVVEA